MNVRFQIVDEPYSTFIRDTINQINFCMLCENTMGLKKSARDLAQEVCDFLNETNKQLEY